MPWWRRLPFFYGWVIVAVASVCFAVGYASWHSFSVFYVAILEEFGWSRAATAAAFSVFTIVYGLNSPISGWLNDRFGPRVVFPIGAFVLCVGLLLNTRISELWQFYLLFGVVAALGLSCFGMVPTFAILNNWFVRRRGTAAGLATAGIGVGILVLVPGLQVVILNYGWRTAYVVLAVVTVLIVPVLSCTCYRCRPQEMGLLPDGQGKIERPGRSRLEPVRAEALVADRRWVNTEWTLHSALRTRRFWVIFLARFLEMVVLNLLAVHQVAFFVDMGYDRLLAASVAGMVGAVGAGSKVLWGVVSDRIGREMAFTFAFCFTTAGVLILLSLSLLPGLPVWALYAYALIYGMGYGASSVLMPILSGDIFQGKRFGSILGGLYIGSGVGSAMGAFLGGYVFDLTHSYTWAFVLVIAFVWLACLLYWLSAPRKVRLVGGKARKAIRLQPQQ